MLLVNVRSFGGESTSHSWGLYPKTLGLEPSAADWESSAVHANPVPRVGLTEKGRVGTLPFAYFAYFAVLLLEIRTRAREAASAAPWPEH